jgi:8-oxo-dGTP diphosphatase
LNIYKETNEIETFRFVAWNKFSAETVTLPIDKIVAAMLKEKY